MQQTTVSLEPSTQHSSLQGIGNVRGDEDCQGDKPWSEGQQEPGLLSCMTQAKDQQFLYETQSCGVS